MSEASNEVYRQSRTAQDKSTYFLLAAAAAAIGLALERTKGSALEWSMVPLGLAVVSWGLSFYCGCVHLKYVNSILSSNLELLKVQSGTHADIAQHPEHVADAADGIKNAIESKSVKGSRFAKIQFQMLILGAVLFISWHVIDMACHGRRGNPTTSTVGGGDIRANQKRSSPPQTSTRRNWMKSPGSSGGKFSAACASLRALRLRSLLPSAPRCDWAYDHRRSTSIQKGRFSCCED
jgi:hypothetical protein